MMDNVSEWEINLDDAISRASSNQKLFARFGVLKMLEGARTKLSNRAQAQTIAKRLQNDPTHRTTTDDHSPSEANFCAVSY
jgi:hypothetical protein